MFRSLLAKVSLETNRRPDAEARRRGRRAAPRLETMEGRLLLNGDGATFFRVTNASGSASVPGSLPYEVSLANANPNPHGSLISFSLTSPQTITLDRTLTLSETAGPIKIVGPLHGGITIDGNHQVQVVAIKPGVSATLKNLTIANGSTPSTVLGAGIGNQGTLTLADSTLMGNRSGGYAGGLFNGWSATITDCTIADNFAANKGGGIFNEGTLTAVSDTIAGNTAHASIGAGLVNANSSSTLLADTIVAGNTGAYGISGDILGTVSSSSSYNLIGTRAGGLINGVNHNQIGANPLLSPLGLYHGATPTMALLPGSPAIAAGSGSIAGVTVPTYDERAIWRPSGSVDVGAFQDLGFNLVSTATPITAYNGYYQATVGYTLTTTVSSPYGDPVAGGVVTYTLSPDAQASLSQARVSIADTGQAVTSVSNHLPRSSPTQRYNVTASALGATSSVLTLLSTEQL